MGHPHKSQAKSSSSTKMRAITGKGGAGSAHLGMSPFKRANKHGEQESFNSHSKGFEAGYAHGGAVKARGDRRARGGKTSGKVKSTESMRNENASKLGMSTPGHFANGGRSRPKHKGDVNIVIMQPHKAPGPGAGMGMGAGAGQGLTGAPSPPPPGAGASPMAGGQPNPQAQAALQAIAGGGGMGMGGLGGLGAGMKAGGGRIKKQTGGAVPYTAPSRTWRDQAAGQAVVPSAAQGAEDYARRQHDVEQYSGQMPDRRGIPPNVSVMQANPMRMDAPEYQHEAEHSGEYSGPPSTSPHFGSYGGGDEKGPTGDVGVGDEGMKRGGNSFKFKKGGATWTATRDARAGGGRTTGEMPGDEAHWAKYASQNRKSKRGGTGESEELTLSTPEHKESDIKKADQRARGGRLGTTSKRKGGLPGAGQQTGEARLQQYRKGKF